LANLAALANVRVPFRGADHPGPLDLRGQELAGYRLLQSFILGEPNFAHAAAAQETEEDKAPVTKFWPNCNGLELGIQWH